MTERERWIVYPLLFLALGAGLRDKLFDQTRSKKIVCQELIVYGEDGGGHEPVPLVRIGSAPRSTTSSPQVAEVAIAGRLQADLVAADLVSGNNFAYRGIQFAPTLLRTVPEAAPGERPRASRLPAEPQGRSEEGAQAADPPTEERTQSAATPPAE